MAAAGLMFVALLLRLAAPSVALVLVVLALACFAASLLLLIAVIIPQQRREIQELLALPEDEQGAARARKR